MSHAHSQPHTTSSEKNIRIALLLNVAFTCIEIVGGILTNSLAILADALHDLGDSIALFVSWILEKKSKRAADAVRTFGYKRLSLLSALISGSILVGGSVFIIIQALQRLYAPEPVYAPGMIGLALIGIAFNGAGFLKLKTGASMNEKTLSWHLLEDVLGWVTILVGAILMYFFTLPILDPILTILFTGFTLWGVSKPLKESFNIFLQGVPAHINLAAVTDELRAVPRVKAIHDVHVWSLDGDTDILTAHVVLDSDDVGVWGTVRADIQSRLAKHHIEHATLEHEVDGSCTRSVCEAQSIVTGR